MQWSIIRRGKVGRGFRKIVVVVTAAAKLAAAEDARGSGGSCLRCGRRRSRYRGCRRGRLGSKTLVWRGGAEQNDILGRMGMGAGRPGVEEVDRRDSTDRSRDWDDGDLCSVCSVQFSDPVESGSLPRRPMGNFRAAGRNVRPHLGPLPQDRGRDFRCLSTPLAWVQKWQMANRKWQMRWGFRFGEKTGFHSPMDLD